MDPITNTGLTLFWQSGLGKKFAHEFEFIYQEYKNSLLQREGLGLVLLGDELSAALDAPRSDTPHLQCPPPRPLSIPSTPQNHSTPLNHAQKFYNTLPPHI